MEEYIQRLKHIRAIMLVIPDTPVKGVQARIDEAMELIDGLIQEAKVNNDYLEKLLKKQQEARIWNDILQEDEY